eukprot:scaffold115765_cov72-Phaeocystis_antarctica.AAC.2
MIALRLRQLVGAAAQEAEEGVKPAPRGQKRRRIKALVPLANQVRCVAQSLQVLWQQRVANRRGILAIEERKICRACKQLVRKSSGEKAGTGWRADRLGVEGLKEQALPCKRIQHGRVQRRVPPADAIIPEIVGQGENNVWRHAWVASSCWRSR